MKDTSGEWSGLTVDLWKEIAENLELRYRFVEESPDAILDAIDRGRLDTAAGPFAMTLEREREVDFTHGYVVSGVSVAVRPRRESGPLADGRRGAHDADGAPALRWRRHPGVPRGAALWLLERRRNAMFAGRPLQGIGSGFWWSGVTTVGVGYGDKVPITFWGRLVALFWMFVSLVLVTALTAFVTAKLALADFGRVQGPASLHNALVGSVEGSAANDLLRREGISPHIYPSASAAVAGSFRAKSRLWSTAPPSCATTRTAILLTGSRFCRDTRGVELRVPPAGRKPPAGPLNDALRRILAESHWQDVRTRYLGVGAPGRSVDVADRRTSLPAHRGSRSSATRAPSGSATSSTYRVRPRPGPTGRSSARATPTRRRSRRSGTSRRRSRRPARGSKTSSARACTSSTSATGRRSAAPTARLFGTSGPRPRWSRSLG